MTPQRLCRCRLPLPQQEGEVTPEARKRSQEHRPVNSYEVRTRHEELNSKLSA